MYKSGGFGLTFPGPINGTIPWLSIRISIIAPTQLPVKYERKPVNVCLGNLQQIDTPYLTETTSGLTYVVDRFKKWAHSGHVTLMNVERSRLADFASETL